MAPSDTSVRDARGLGLVARNVDKSFGSKRVLQRFDLEIAPGSFVSIVGKSGCGKSTFLRLLTELDTPTAGTIALGPEGRHTAAASVRMMYQEPRLLPWETVLGNVLIGLGDGGNSAERLASARSALAAVGLADRESEWPSVLSGGQRQRVALARALVSHPGILALDEPLGALDALTRIEMQSLLEQVWKDKGLTALMVTHDVSEAIALGDRVVVIEDGRITLDVPVDLPRPRQRGTPAFGALEARLLNQLMRSPGVSTEVLNEICAEVGDRANT